MLAVCFFYESCIQHQKSVSKDLHLIDRFSDFLVVCAHGDNKIVSYVSNQHAASEYLFPVVLFN